MIHHKGAEGRCTVRLNGDFQTCWELSVFSANKGLLRYCKRHLIIRVTNEFIRSAL